MGKGKHRTYPENDDKTKQLRKALKERDKEIERLKAELKTLNTAFLKVSGYIKSNLDNISVEKVIEGVKKDKTMVDIKSDNCCPNCNGELKFSKLPFGSMELCLLGCGYRKVVSDKDNV